MSEQGEVTLRDELRSAVNELTERDGAESDAGKIQKIEEGRARDEAGRFVSKPLEEKPAQEKPTDVKPSPEPAGKVGDVQATPVAPKFKVPDSIKAELKAKFNALPEEWQAELVRREGEVHKQFTANDEHRALGRRVSEMAMPYQAIIQAEGATVDSAFKDYLNVAYVLRGQNDSAKAQALAQVAMNFRVNPNLLIQALGFANSGQGQPVQADPRVAQLEQVVQQLQQGRQQDEQQRQAWEQAQLNAEIEEFAAAAGHEHFGQVRQFMGILMENGQAESLQDAYDKAVWSDPTIRSTLAANPEQKRLTEATQKAQAAKRAAVSVTGAPGATSPDQNPSPASTLRDEIRQQMRAATGRI